MRLIRQLWFQVLVAMVAGAVLGYVRPNLGAQMQPLGDAFVSLIRMIIGPVIFCTVVHGVASMNDMKRVGRVALKAIIWFEAITLVALVFALVAVNLWQPGAGMNVDVAALDAKSVATYTAAAQHQTVSEFLLHIIPATLVSAFAQGDVLQVLFVSVLFAFALVLTGEAGKPVLDFIGRLSQIFFRIVGLIMWAAPLGAFGAIAFTVGRFGATSLLSLGELILEFYVVSLLFVFIVLGTVAWGLGVSILRLIHYIREELLIVIATTSSETVLPRLVRKLQTLGCEESVVGLVIPTGYSFNLDGTCLYLATVSVFLAQATNTPLALEQQLVLLAVALLTSKGAAGIAGAAFVVLAATIASVGSIPVGSIALVLGIHRLLSQALTPVNVMGNCIATILVAKWDRALDEKTLYAQVGLRPARAVAVAKRIDRLENRLNKNTNPPYIPFHPSPSKPRFKVPAGAVDAHCHVFGPAAKFPYAPERKYTPVDAPKEKLFALRDFLGFDKNVIVQASCHGTDNAALLDALVNSNGKAKGVAVIGESVTDAELKMLNDAGVKGVRFNFVKRLVDFTPRDVLERLAARIAPMGWHIVVYFEMPDLPDLESFFTSLPTTVVVDHMGRPDVKKGVAHPEFQRYLNLLDQHRNIWSKVSCPERLTAAGAPYDDVVPFARTLVERYPERVLWGTDWPHPNMPVEAPDDGVLVDVIPKIATTPQLQQALLVDNPMRLYWN